MAYQKYKDIPNRREPLAGRDHIQHIENEVIRELARVEPKGAFLPLRNVSLTEIGAGDVQPIDAIGGTLYGRGLGGDAPTSTLYRSTDDGATWQAVATGLNSPSAVRQLGNGEVFVLGTEAAYVSNGWATDPLAATWTTVATPTENGGANPDAYFLPFNLDVYDRYVLLGEYVVPDRTNSRALRFSQDYGQTFTTLLDLNELKPGEESGAHWHAACIDPWANTPSGIRLWASNGDNSRRDMWYSDDLGASWTIFGEKKWQPTTLTATPAGIVVGTDESPDGIFRILRTDDPADMKMEPMHLIRRGGVGGALYGFATRGFYHAETGLVYISFRSDQGVIPGMVFVSDGYTADMVYETPFIAGLVNVQNISVVDGGSVHWWISRDDTSTRYHAKADQVGRGSRSFTEMFRESFGGTLSKNSVVLGTPTDEAAMVAIGVNTQVAPGGLYSVVIGHAAKQLSTSGYGVAVGKDAATSGAYGTAVGYQAGASANSVAAGRGATSAIDAVAVGSEAVSTNAGVAVGRNAKNPSTAGGIAVGYQAETASAATNGIAIGRSTKATSAESTAVGANATASASNAVALGKSAAATNARSVALGFESTTTAADQVQIGARHIELGELASDPAAPPADKARLFARDNGSGKTEICVRFATGAVAVLATEP